jgi:hypothetical protein
MSTLTEVAPGLWSAIHLLRLPAGVRMPARMTVVRLGDGGLVVHSPIPADDELAAAIAALGPVRQVVAPNRIHHLFVAPFLQRFPGASLLGAPGLPAKRPDLTFAGTLDGTAPWPELAQTTIDGAPKIGEVVFFHRPSRSLIVTDLLFNVTRPASFSTGLLMRAMGNYRRLAGSRIWRFQVRDRAAFRTSLDRVLAWDFVRILPGHGEVYDAPDAHERARAILTA